MHVVLCVMYKVELSCKKSAKLYIIEWSVVLANKIDIKQSTNDIDLSNFRSPYSLQQCEKPNPHFQIKKYCTLKKYKKWHNEHEKTNGRIYDKTKIEKSNITDRDQRQPQNYRLRK